MANLEERLQRIERTVGSGAPCPACGTVAGSAVTIAAELDLVGGGGGDERCGVCGRELVIVLDMGGAGDDDEL